ncbi:phage major capsid protein [Paenibacillus qinlingensis]|uniref:HK97 family phage major capsid protein/HK97 family phage prohead protease n=1 Tax=Paenibacillus qinlingensis TaxID=1837343 RepID=A0ABU1NRB5_9BACL|nr:phage major capsid protein [Paenibacillus qinlingensis]MDR6550023.1 HK97 family phage major capsid protein/HK97 family phage prohead protease [Paenibacillus qinlingensis]
MKLEIRNDSVKISGYVNVTQRDSRTLSDEKRGKFIEQIMPKAFDQALSRASNVDLLFNHKQDRRLGSTQEGSLELYEDVIGLRAEATVTDEEVVQRAKDGKLTGWSFGFHAKDSEWQNSTPNRRYVKDLDLVEVSILDVTPAYYGTTIEQRDGSDDLEIRTTEVKEMKDIEEMSAKELHERRNDLLETVEQIEIKLQIEDEKRGFEIMTVVKDVAQNAELEARKLDDQAFLALVKKNRTDAVEGRALTAGTNGSVIPVSVANRIIEVAKNVSPILAKATIWNVKGDLQLPAYDYTAHVFEYVQEGTPVNDTGGQFTGPKLTNYILGALTKVSNSLINRTDLDVVPIIIRQIGLSLALFLEKEIIQETGAKLKGLKSGVTVTATSTNSTTAVIDAKTVTDLIGLQMKVPQIHQANSAWLMSPQVWTAIRSLTGASGQLLISGDDSGIAEDGGLRLFGKPVMLSDQMPATLALNARGIYYGDFSGLDVKFTTDVQVKVLQERYADSYQTGVVCFQELDSVVGDPSKFAVLLGK